MDCSQADILLIDYIYGELPEPQRQAFEHHLQSCSVHAGEVERLRAVLTLMRKDQREDPSDRVSKEILQAAELSIGKASKPWGWFSWIRTPIAAAAALVVVIGIGTLVYVSEGDDHKVVSEKTKPAISNIPAPQQTAERMKGIGEKERRLSREQPPEKQAPRREEIAQKLSAGAPAERAFTSEPEEYKKDYAGSADAVSDKKPKQSLSLRATASAPSTMAADVKVKSKAELPPLRDSDVTEVMRNHKQEFAACGQMYSSIKGSMRVSFVIANNGVVSSVSVLAEEFKGSAYAECISAEIKKIVFPQFGGEPKTVTLPFVVK